MKTKGGAFCYNGLNIINAMMISAEKFLKAFLVGSSITVFLVPLLGYWSFAVLANPETSYSVATIPVTYPIVIGLLNVLYQFLKPLLPFKSSGNNYLFIGLVYGIILSLIGKFVMDFPTQELETPEQLQYLVFIFAPIAYALVFRWIIKPLNQMLGVE